MNEKLAALLGPIFNDIADPETGELGDPNGHPAYAYIRVSTSGQAEEGRSGLPRQLMHIHKRAKKLSFRVPFTLLYGDDHTGFEFKDRPDLQLLLTDISRPDRPANTLVMENLDRLSRNAKWHQGYLLDVFEQQGVSVHFWKAFNSEIERAVMGAISEEGMRSEIERMTQGMRMKAESGRITARRPSYGFIFVDSKGRPASDPTSDYRKDTHYALHPDESLIMKEIYNRIVGGESLFEVCNDLERRQVPTPKHAKHWSTGNLSKMLKNPLYKGEFVANRFYMNEEWSEREQRMVKRQREKPEEEWIIIPVPPIVSAKIWMEAQKALKRNQRKSTRNAKSSCLLQGFIVCARCGNKYISGGTTGPIVNGKRSRRFYICGSYNHTPVIRQHLYCKSPILYRDVIDPRVWESVCTLITDPDILMSYIEEEHDRFKRGELSDQLAYLERQLNKCRQEEARWDQAYAAGIFGIEEYKDKKHGVSARKAALETEREKLSEEMVLVELFERKRELIYEHLTLIQKSGFALDIPFTDKRKIIAMIIDQVVIDSEEGWYRLEGAIEGTYVFQEDSESGSSSHFTSTSAP